MNNILDHFATAFFSLHLKGKQDKKAYLDVIPKAKNGVYALDKEGKPGVRWSGEAVPRPYCVVVGFGVSG